MDRSVMILGGNLVDGLGNPIKEVEEMLEKKEEGQESDEELKLKQEQEDIRKWHLEYIQLMEHVKNQNIYGYG